MSLFADFPSEGPLGVPRTIAACLNTKASLPFVGEGGHDNGRYVDRTLRW